MTTKIVVDGLTPQEHKEVLVIAIKTFGKETVTDGTNTYIINNYIGDLINGFSELMNNEKNLKNYLKNIDLYVNVEDGNLEYDGFGRYKIIGTQNNKFTKAYRKAVRDFKKIKDSKNPTLINLKEAEKAEKKQILEYFKESIKIGTILVESKCSRSIFYTVTKIYLTKQNKVKAVDVRYTDSAEDNIMECHQVTPGAVRMEDRWLYENRPVTSRGVVIEKVFSGGTWDTIGCLYDENRTYTYDSCAD